MRLTAIDPEAYSIEGGSLTPPSSFLQTPFWASFKARHGWQPRYFVVEGLPERDRFFLTVLVRRMARVAAIAYVPLGPDVMAAGENRQGEILLELGRLLKPYLPRGTICVRFDPPWGTVVPNSFSGRDGDEGADAAKAEPEPFPVRPPKPIRHASADIQPPDTVQLDLALSEEDLLSGMKPKWRYNIRLGEKKGVTVSCLLGAEAETTGVDAFYALYLETASRDGIAIHSRDYYRDLIAHAEASMARASRSPFDKPVSVRVYLARHEEDTLAAIITLFCGEEAVYLYGASSNVKRNLMPAYSLQWKAIRDAKGAGCLRYDFYGMPPKDDPTHPMYGLYRFKTGFGGAIVHRVGSLDVPARPIAYALYRAAETVRAFWFKKAVKFLTRETPRKS
jgi:lipid II:glycine glycyltransferase (peptidoglycan interpeptide bridge formation enzyme)